MPLDNDHRSGMTSANGIAGGEGSSTADVLNRLIAVHYRSFPSYLCHAHPWTPGGHQESIETIHEIVADQGRMVERISDVLFEADEPVDDGEFPMEFTDTHDLSLDFVIRLAVDYQKQDIGVIRQCVEDLRLAPAARSLAEESLGMAQGHLESLEELSAAGKE